jgi:hypothetical protein
MGDIGDEVVGMLDADRCPDQAGDDFRALAKVDWE